MTSFFEGEMIPIIPLNPSWTKPSSRTRPNRLCARQGIRGRVMNLQAVVHEIERAGGILKLEAESNVRVMLPPGMENLMEVLRAHKPELIDLLKSRGGRVASFPHCPRCASYALYRTDNIGAYECQSCGLTKIEESLARMLQ